MSLVENVHLKQAGNTTVNLDALHTGDEADSLDPKFDLDKLTMLKNWWYTEYLRQVENRAEQAKDASYYDHHQWSDEDERILEERGQKPVVFNKIKQTIDWLVGTERRTKADFKVHSRKKEGEEESKTKTALLKYVADVSKMPFARSDAFEKMLKAGVGWLEVGVKSDPEDEPLFIREESWKNIWHDSLATQRDLADARYLFRAKTLDLDVAVSMFPDWKQELEEAAEMGQDFFPFKDEDIYNSDPWEETGDNKHAAPVTTFGLTPDRLGDERKRVTLVECWYREVADVKIIRGNIFKMGTLEGQIISDESDPDIYELLSKGYATLHDARKMVVRQAVFTPKVLLQDIASPYNHNRFPFVPIWGFKDDRSGLYYGSIRGLRGVQDDLNKRRSKSLHILCSNQVIADGNAVDDWDELAAELKRPDGIMKIKQNARFDFSADRGLAREHLTLMDQDAQFITENVGGAFNMGQAEGDLSGKAQQERRDQADVSTTQLFDNHHYAFQILGEITLSLVEQFYDEAKEFRVLGEDGQVEYIEVNDRQEDGSVLNDITASKADFVCDRRDYKETVRQAMYESMINLLGQVGPEVAIQLLDIVVSFADDIPNKAEVIKRIQQINGHDPEQEGKPSPEEEMQMQQMQLEMQRMQAEIQKLGAESGLIQAQVGTEQADAQSKLARIKKDDEISTINRAETVSRIQGDARKQDREDKETMRRLEDSIKGRIREEMNASQAEHDRQLRELTDIVGVLKELVDDGVSKKKDSQ